MTPHSPYFGPGFIATLHIVAALIEKPLVEVLWLRWRPTRSTRGSAVDGKVLYRKALVWAATPTPRCLHATRGASPHVLWPQD